MMHMEKITFTQNNTNMLVSEIMIPIDQFPVIREKTIFKEALEKMGQAGLGIVCIVDNNTKLLGILTDGDIRRKLLKVQKPLSAFFIDDAIDHAIHSPVTSNPNDLLISAIDLMGKKKVWDLPVINDQGVLVGLLHLHPAVKALLGL